MCIRDRSEAEPREFGWISLAMLTQFELMLIVYNFYFFQGVLTAVPLAFILPAVSYLKLEEGSIFSKAKLPALGVTVFGLIIAFVGVALITFNFEQDERCSHGNVMGYCNATYKD